MATRLTRFYKIQGPYQNPVLHAAVPDLSTITLGNFSLINCPSIVDFLIGDIDEWCVIVTWA